MAEAGGAAALTEGAAAKAEGLLAGMPALGIKPRMVDVATQAKFRPASASASPWGEAWRDGGRATFRPSTSEQGRPKYTLDKEDVERERRALKKAVAEAEKERDSLRVKLARSEEKGREKDRIVAQALLERGQELPARVMALVQECVRSDATAQLEHLKGEVRRKQEEINLLRTRGGENVHPHVGDITPKRRLSSSRQHADDDSATDSPTSARASRKGASLLPKGQGSEVLLAARAEIERLQKLYNAGEVVRDGLERRIAELEAEVSRAGARASADPSSPAKEGGVGQEGGGEAGAREGGGRQEEIYTQDNRDFENYIRRLAGLPELPAKDKGDRASQRVRVGLGPKASAAGGARQEGPKEREWAMYEVTTVTSPEADAGTSAQAYVTFRGELGDYGPCLLERPDGGAPCLAAGRRDVFDVCALDVGPLRSLVVSHDNSGPSPAWHLSNAIVRRARTAHEEARTYEFFYGGWVAIDRGPKALQVEINLSSRPAHGTTLTVSGDSGGHAPVGAGGVLHGHGRAVGEGIEGEALAGACRSVCKAALELHVPESVADSHLWGLTTLARQLTPKPIRPPPSCRNLLVMLVGPRTACTQFVEWFAGAKMTNCGIGTEANITIACMGRASRVRHGEEAAGMAAHAGPLLAVPRLGKRLCVEEMVGGERRFGQVSFIHPPVIEGDVAGAASTAVMQALNELRGELESLTNLKAVFREFDRDGSGSIDLREFQGAMAKLGIDMPGPRAERLFKALDVSGEGGIEYEEFLAAFRPARTTFDYDLEQALEIAADRADLIVTLIDPKNVHYKARELHNYKMLHSKFPHKLKLFTFLRDSVRADPRLKSHLLVETRTRMEEAFSLPAGSLPPLQTVFLPPAQGAADAGMPVVENGMDSLLMSFAEGLLALENAAVDETHDSLRMILDACFECEDVTRLEDLKPRISKWIKAFADGTSRKKHPPTARFHKALTAALKDLQRGHVVSEDVEGWTPAQVGAWLKSKSDLSRYANAMIDEGINGRKLVSMSEDTLKRKLAVQSLGHRKEIMRQIRLLLEARKNFLKQ